MTNSRSKEVLSVGFKTPLGEASGTLQAPQDVASASWFPAQFSAHKSIISVPSRDPRRRRGALDAAIRLA